MLRSAPALVLALELAAPALAQDPTAVDPRHYSVILETDVIRVVRVTYPPGERSPTHEHPANVTLALSDIDFRLTFPDGETSHLVLSPGRVGWGAGVVHETENIGKDTGRVMAVEFKKARMADGVRQRESPPQPIELGPGMAGEALIDNDLVAVRRVRVKPGGYSEPHTNDDRDLVILPYLGNLEVTIGQERRSVGPGEVEFVSRGTRHTEANPTGDQVEWVAILIEPTP